jgi:hypothetical protein
MPLLSNLDLMVAHEIRHYSRDSEDELVGLFGFRLPGTPR